MAKPRAAVYVRISQDRDGTSGGTDRQEKDCKALCRREGIDVAHVYRDDDTSAYSGRRRPAFEQMLGDLDRYDVLVYWKTDRLVRRISAIWRVIDACEAANVRLVSVHDQIDTSSPMGKAVVGVLAAAGEQESANISLRVRRKHDDLAAAGLPSGHRRAFGYEIDAMTIVESEAATIREARDRILAGESMTSICSDWNARGVMPTMAPAWRVTTFKKMMTGGRIAGRRTHRGEDVGQAAWPAIISKTDHDKIVRRLGDPKVTKRGRPARYLLTSLARCGVCGNTLRASVSSSNGRSWACRSLPGDEDRCGSVSVDDKHLEPLVEAAILHRLSSPTLARSLAKASKRGSEPEADYEALADLDARLIQLGIDHDEGLLSRAEWLDRRGRLQQRLDKVKASLAVSTDFEPVIDLAGAKDIRGAWGALPIEARRAIATALIEKVVINTVAHGGHFDPARVDVEWRA